MIHIQEIVFGDPHARPEIRRRRSSGVKRLLGRARADYNTLYSPVSNSEYRHRLVVGRSLPRRALSPPIHAYPPTSFLRDDPIDKSCVSF
ncbi:unnamed protein product [Caenorhabditis auriculariae]|uniref:Uncharacterized protein n=1 Tax=Caenorhabditis auriculariae TaxID=2777116 RepID=A0A8S1H9U1_9PELO|nr:unnamed protein product [Caenorhabditis auriculariae]